MHLHRYAKNKNYYSVTSYICICFKLYIIKVNREHVSNNSRESNITFPNNMNYIRINGQIKSTDNESFNFPGKLYYHMKTAI